MTMNIMICVICDRSGHCTLCTPQSNMSMLPRKMISTNTTVPVPRRLFFYCPSMNSHRPKSQNTAKERALIPEKDSTRKRPRSHISLEKSSKNYKPLENWAKPNLLRDVTPQPANYFGDCFRRVCHVVKPEPREFLAVFTSQINWPN